MKNFLDRLFNNKKKSDNNSPSENNNKSQQKSPSRLPNTPQIAPLIDNTAPTEQESLTTKIPTTYYELFKVIKKITSNPIDQFGRKRLTPSKEYWATGTENIPMFDENGQFIGVELTRLDIPPIFYGEYTSVFNLKGDPSKVIRYNVVSFTEQSKRELCSTATNYWFLKRLEYLNIAPKVYYYSAPLDPIKVQLKEGDIGKVRILPSKESKTQHEIRFMIMEKVGPAIYTYMCSLTDRKTTFADAIRIGGQIIEMIETLHSLDIVHGDIHMGNVAVDNNRLVLIDFGRSRIISECEQMEQCIKVRSHYWISPRISCWEMQKYSYSYRDDLYRWMQVVAGCMYGDKYLSYMDHVNYSKEEWSDEVYESMRNYAIDMKLKGEIFELPLMEITSIFPENIKRSFSLDEIVSDSETVDDVRRLLGEIVTHVLQVNLFSKPDYGLIKGKLIEILALVEDVDTDSKEAFNMAFTFTTSDEQI